VFIGRRDKPGDDETVAQGMTRLLIPVDRIPLWSGTRSGGIGLTLRQAQGEVFFSILMLSLPAYAEASSGR